MTEFAEIETLEKQFWTGDAAFYREHADARCLLIFGAEAEIMSSERLAGSVERAPRWRAVGMSHVRVLPVSEAVCVIHYEAHALRSEHEHYRALVSSLYVRRASTWKLAFHQQVPLAQKRSSAS
jgi:tRNA(Leu) C34 or U34 (ribose-2'-O)-methylase TrmL